MGSPARQVFAVEQRDRMAKANLWIDRVAIAGSGGIFFPVNASRCTVPSLLVVTITPSSFPVLDADVNRLGGGRFFVLAKCEFQTTI